jgi:hypothetical protein
MTALAIPRRRSARRAWASVIAASSVPGVAGREGIVAVAVPIADPPVDVVNHDLRLLIPRDVASRVDRMGLGAMMGGVAGVVLATNSPPVFAPNNVLVLAHLGNLRVLRRSR